jgi:hypothetical protein
VDRHPARLQIALELGATGPDGVRPLQRIHALMQGPFRRRRGLAGEFVTGGIGRRVYIFAMGQQGSRQNACTST